MWAIRQHAFGGPEELHFEQVPDLRPCDEQVRIRVESAGVHLVDTTIRRGESGPFPPPDLPMTPGREVAGLIDAVGPGTDQSWLGQRVVAHLGMASGGYAEMAVAVVSSLHSVPDSLDADAAVAMIGTGRTTMAILDLAPPTERDVILVTAAAGGIGALVVQAGHKAGATVVAVAGGARKIALAGSSAPPSRPTTTSPAGRNRYAKRSANAPSRRSSTASAAPSGMPPSSSSDPAADSSSTAGRRERRPTPTRQRSPAAA